MLVIQSIVFIMWKCFYIRKMIYRSISKVYTVFLCTFYAYYDWIPQFCLLCIAEIIGP